MLNKDEDVGDKLPSDDLDKRFIHPLEKPKDCSQVKCEAEPNCPDDMVLATPTHSCCPRCSFPDEACRKFLSPVSREGGGGRFAE